MGRVKELLIDLHNQNPQIDDYDYLYNEWLKQFEPKQKVKKLKTKKNEDNSNPKRIY
jgi:hypothetical protein